MCKNRIYSHFFSVNFSVHTNRRNKNVQKFFKEPEKNIQLKYTF